MSVNVYFSTSAHTVHVFAGSLTEMMYSRLFLCLVYYHICNY